MNKVVEIGGSGAYEKLHTQGDDIYEITEIVYFSSFTSMKEVIVKSVKYLKQEKNRRRERVLYT